MQISGEKYYRIIQSILNKYKYSSIPEEVRKAFEKELRIRLSSVPVIKSATITPNPVDAGKTMVIAVTIE